MLLVYWNMYKQTMLIQRITQFDLQQIGISIYMIIIISHKSNAKDLIAVSKKKGQNLLPYKTSHAIDYVLSM